jgi:gliding motility-associated-like protein
MELPGDHVPMIPGGLLLMLNADPMGIQKNMNRVWTILLWSIIPFIASAQPFSNKGKEFWVGYGHHQYMEPACGAPGDGPNNMNMVLYLSAEQAAQVTVTIDNGGAAFPPQWTRTYNIPANTVISTENLPKGATDAGPSNSDPSYDARLFTKPPPGGTGGEGLFQKRGIHIVSNVPIVAYAHIYGGVSSGATMLMPVHTWGYSYTSVNSEQGDASQSYSWMYVVAKDNNTRVRITPSAPSRAGKPANTPFEVVLQKGEIYQLVGQADCATGNGPELTGTTVKSIAGADGACHPIAVFGGSSRTGGEAGLCGSSGRDNDMQQLFPEQAWGMLYLTAPFSKASSTTLYPSQFQRSVYKVVVKDPATQVRINGGAPLTGLINNKYYKFSSNTANYITSDKPVMVAQFMPGGGTACNTGLGTDGDPEMVILSPTEQASKRVGFYRNTLQAINSNFLTLIVPTAGVASLLIDNSSVFSHTYPHTYPGYTVVVKGWPAAQAQCVVQCDSGFNAITYGLGGAESYGYNAGTNILNLNGVSDIHNVYDSTKKSNVFTCTKTPVELSALIAYKPTKLEWKLSALGAMITPNADVTDNNPVPVDSTDVNGFRYYKYTLPQAYVFGQPGTYYLPLIATSPTIDVCTRSEEFSLEIIVKPTPKADFTFTQGGCRLDTVIFAALNTSGNGYTIDRWRWAYPDGKADSVQNPRHYFASTGPHNIYLKVLTPEGCMGDTIKPITLTNIVVNASIVAAQDSICEGGSITFTDTSISTGVSSWYWDFGNGTTSTVTANTPQTASYPAYGTYTVKHLAYAPGAGSCAGDTVRKVITILAKPAAGFTYPPGCLPVSGAVQFTDTSSTPDGQTITAWTWDFNDPNATAANPNTSTLQHPAHTYTNYGAYNIIFSATTAKGCTRSVTVPATFNVRPQLSYPALTAVCENTTGAVSVATASVTNGIAGTGVYSGPGTDAAGNFTPSIAGPGNHKIYFTFTTPGGCVVMDSSYVLVKPKPVTAFTYPPGCLPVDGLVQFVNNTAPPAGETITGYTWNFGDANALPADNTSTLTNPIHNYKNNGTYNITLTATSSNGCTGNSTAVAILALTPQLAWPALPAVCESTTGTVSVATASVTNGVAGTGVYSGPGTDAAGNFRPLIAGPGTHTITYTFTAGGCTASIPNTIVVHPKPNAVFTATSDICLNQAATIEDNSTIPSGSITTWNWNFGDGNTASYANGNSFTRSWATYNTYNVTLTATSNNGCTASKTMSVAVHALPAVDFELPAGICVPGGNAAFKNLTTIPDNAGISYQWTFGDGGLSSSAPNPSHVYAARNAYNVNLTATSVYGCTGTALKVLTPDRFFDKPIAAFKAAPEAVCQGTEQEFSDLSTAPNSTVRGWNWNFGDGSISTVRNPAKKYRLPGVYTVALQVTNEVGCMSDPVTHTATVYLQPVIDAGGSFVVAQGTLVKFNPKANDSTVVTFQWTPATDLSDATILRPTMVAQQDRTYRLTATGEGNCTASDELTVKILRPVKIPNVFSPNGDGVNDTWFIENLADYTGCMVEVFNRYGQRVYYAGGYSNPWNGTFNGQSLPVATYYYVIHLKNGFQPLTGSVTILR